MSRRRHSFLNLAPEQLAGIGLLGVVLIAICILLITHYARPDALSGLKNTLIGISQPVAELFGAPGRALNDAGGWVDDVVALNTENARLRTENEQLLAWQSKAMALASENNALRELLNAVPDGDIKPISARIIGMRSNAYRHLAMISAGSTDGIKPYQAVITARGYVGYTSDVGTSSAGVVLLSDSQSRLPVMGEISRERAILTGNSNGDPLRLEYVSRDTQLTKDERLVTSGDGGIIPHGIPVAHIASVQETNVLAVPFTDPQAIEYVTILDYEF